MLTRENAAGGTSLVLGPGDSLDEVPASHADMVTADIRHVFRDPIAHFREIARQCRIPSVAQWLSALVASGKWNLVLDECWMMERSTQASFYLPSKDVQSAFISPALDATRTHSLPAFAHYYSLVDVVHWDSFGCAGGLAGREGHVPLSARGVRCRSKDFPIQETSVFGGSACGDMLIYTRAGDAGFLSHESGDAYSLGKVDQALNYVFGELLARRTPEFDYAKA
jgi:hypothetical protein